MLLLGLVKYPTHILKNLEKYVKIQYIVIQKHQNILLGFTVCIEWSCYIFITFYFDITEVNMYPQLDMLLLACATLCFTEGAIVFILTTSSDVHSLKAKVVTELYKKRSFN